jgi:ferredoxin
MRDLLLLRLLSSQVPIVARCEPERTRCDACRARVARYMIGKKNYVH